MKLIYIAGPYRGKNAWAIEQNIRRAEDAAVIVWKAGHAALCPHANARHMLEGNVTDEHALAGTMLMLQRCDAVMVVEGWQRSEGARAEVLMAMGLGMPVLYAFGDESYTTDILHDLGAMDATFRVLDQRPFDEVYWTGRYAT